MNIKHVALIATVSLTFTCSSSFAAQSSDYEVIPNGEAQILKIGEAVYDITSFSEGSTHQCFITVDEQAMCFGNNEYGQLGDGTNVDHPLPVPVVSLGGGVKMIKASNGYTCAVNANSEALCFGNNNRGQLGSHGKANQALPVKVVGLSAPVVDMELSATRVCVDLENDETVCWGDDFS